MLISWRVSSIEQRKNLGCLGYVRDYTTQLCSDYFINHYKDTGYLLKKAVFHGKKELFFSWLM